MKLRAEFDQKVLESNYCEVSNDCVNIYPGCPLGCNAVVNKVHKEDVENTAARLRSKQSRGGGACEYSCPPPGLPVCKENACTTELQN